MANRLEINSDNNVITINFLKNKDKKIEYEIYGSDKYYNLGNINTFLENINITFERPPDKLLFIKIIEIDYKKYKKNTFIKFYKNYSNCISKNVTMKITKVS